MTVIAAETSEGLIRWRYLPWALAAIAAMIAVIVAGNIWLLDFVHVFSSLLWTGVDLFMGFVLGPILRRVDLSVRREIVRRLTPRTLFLMPTVSIISGTTGWFLAVAIGLHRARLAGLLVGGGGADPGHVDDDPGPRVFDAGQRLRLPAIAEARAGYGQDQFMDAMVFLRGRPAGIDASRDHRRHGAISRRHLSRRFRCLWALNLRIGCPIPFGMGH